MALLLMPNQSQVRELQPKVIEVKNEEKLRTKHLAVSAILRQGISVIKHNIHTGIPQWKVLWLDEKLLIIAKNRFKKPAKKAGIVYHLSCQMQITSNFAGYNSLFTELHQ